MATDPDVARAARNLTTEHGAVAEAIALARAKHAEESNRPAVASTWRHIAALVREKAASQSQREASSRREEPHRREPMGPETVDASGEALTH